MNIKQSAVTATLAGIVILAAAGCGQAQPTSTTPAPAPQATNVAPTVNVPSTGNVPTTGAMPTPPASVSGERPSAPSIDYAAAATKLDITEQQLRDALGDMTQGKPDLAVAATKLGVTEQALNEALGMPSGVPQGGMTPPTGTLPTDIPPAPSTQK